MLALLVLVFVMNQPVARADGPLGSEQMKQAALEAGIRVPGDPVVLGDLSYEGLDYTFATYQDGARTGLLIAGATGSTGNGLLLDEQKATEVICRWNWRAAAKGMPATDWETLRGLAETSGGARGGLEATRAVLGGVREAVNTFENYQKNLAGVPGGNIVSGLLDKLDAVLNIRSSLEALSGQLGQLDTTLSESSAALGRIVTDFTALRSDQPVTCQQIGDDMNAGLDILGKLQPRIADVMNLLGTLASGLNTIESQLRSSGVPDILISPLAGAGDKFAAAQTSLASLNQSVTSAQTTLIRLQAQVNEQNRQRLEQWRYRPNPFGFPGLPNISLPDLPPFIWALAGITVLIGILFILSLLAALRPRRKTR